MPHYAADPGLDIGVKDLTIGWDKTMRAAGFQPNTDGLNFAEHEGMTIDNLIAGHGSGTFGLREGVALLGCQDAIVTNVGAADLFLRLQRQREPDMPNADGQRRPSGLRGARQPLHRLRHRGAATRPCLCEVRQRRDAQPLQRARQSSAFYISYASHLTLTDCIGGDSTTARNSMLFANVATAALLACTAVTCAATTVDRAGWVARGSEDRSGITQD